ncbi:uncharacterized protein LOC131648586 [Vicia villosa]|uniref:uncharacterized protein LOC131648586 n=1 Tax=Vicia villosa TaxID=3911 RepID=UPI00273B92B2|nr:uncharacterized protein LOC131648586 [Vicia villosa]
MALVQDLTVLLQQCSLRVHASDSFSWRDVSSGVFTVKSCYERFKTYLSGPPLNAGLVKEASYLWNVKAPAKILFFGWRIIHNRIATKDQLFKRGVLVDVNDLMCVLCMKKEETLLHLIGGCEITSRIWRRVFHWIGHGLELSFDEFVGFFASCGKVKSLIKRTIAAVIWLATAWCLWLKRNACIFRKELFSFSECMSEIILSSWNWLLSFYKLGVLCNYHTWNILPLLCFEC